jgi:hypothetical protein
MRSLRQRAWPHTRINQALAILVFVVPNLVLSLTMVPASQAVRTTAHSQSLVSFVPLGALRALEASYPVPTVAPTAPAVAPTTVAPAPVVVPAPAPAPAPEQVVDSSSAVAWAASPGVACIREHESGDNYAEDTGNGYYGAYQDALSTWESHGGTGLPNDAAPAVQDQINYEIYLTGGWGQWGTAGRCGL